MFTCCENDDKKSSKKKLKKKDELFCSFFTTGDTNLTQKKNIFQKYLHMGDLEKNDVIF